jgi:hypothetical protein
MRSGSWLDNSQPSLRPLAGVGARTATLGLKHDPNFHGGQQCGILGNERKLDPAISQR